MLGLAGFLLWRGLRRVRVPSEAEADRRLEAKALEVAVLDRSREHRLFRRLPAPRIEELLAQGAGTES